jgi:hypothetical protein
MDKREQWLHGMRYTSCWSWFARPGSRDVLTQETEKALSSHRRQLSPPSASRRFRFSPTGPIRNSIGTTSSTGAAPSHRSVSHHEASAVIDSSRPAGSVARTARRTSSSTWRSEARTSKSIWTSSNRGLSASSRSRAIIASRCDGFQKSGSRRSISTWTTPTIRYPGRVSAGSGDPSLLRAASEAGWSHAVQHRFVNELFTGAVPDAVRT